MIQDKEKRKEIINRYLEGESTREEERLLAEYFAKNLPEKEEEDAALLIRLLATPNEDTEELLAEEGEKEYSKIIAEAYIKRFRPVAFAFLACAAALALFVVFRPKPAIEGNGEKVQEITNKEILEGLNILADINTGNTESISCKPIGDGQIVTVLLKNGEEASYIMIAEEPGKSIRFTALGNN